MDTHRRQVNDAILDATAELIAEHGPLSVAMSAIAERAGIGRATLYRYFSDVESILSRGTRATSPTTSPDSRR